MKASSLWTTLLVAAVLRAGTFASGQEAGAFPQTGRSEDYDLQTSFNKLLADDSGSSLLSDGETSNSVSTPDAKDWRSNGPFKRPRRPPRSPPPPLSLPQPPLSPPPPEPPIKAAYFPLVLASGTGVYLKAFWAKPGAMLRFRLANKASTLQPLLVLDKGATTGGTLLMTGAANTMPVGYSGTVAYVSDPGGSTVALMSYSDPDFQFKVSPKCTYSRIQTGLFSSYADVSVNTVLSGTIEKGDKVKVMLGLDRFVPDKTLEWTSSTNNTFTVSETFKLPSTWTKDSTISFTGMVESKNLYAYTTCNLKLVYVGAGH